MPNKNLNLEFLSKAPDSLKKWARHPSIYFIWAFYLNLRPYFARPETYSQLGEDLEIRKWLPENQGFYIDIGSGFPISGSNSFYFYRLGWKGVAIDPILSNIMLHRLFRSKDKTNNCLVGETTITKNFYHMRPYELSTTEKMIALDSLDRGISKLISIKSIKSIKISDLNIKLNPLEPSFLSIDCEGSDLEVLKGNNFELTRPRVICVEEWSEHENSPENIQNYLLSKQYTLVNSKSLSKIFIANEYLSVSKDKDD